MTMMLIKKLMKMLCAFLLALLMAVTAIAETKWASISWCHEASASWVPKPKLVYRIKYYIKLVEVLRYLPLAFLGFRGFGHQFSVEKKLQVTNVMSVLL